MDRQYISIYISGIVLNMIICFAKWTQEILNAHTSLFITLNMDHYKIDTGYNSVSSKIPSETDNCSVDEI